MAEDFAGWHGRRDDLYGKPFLPQRAQNISFEPKIIGDDPVQDRRQWLEKIPRLVTLRLGGKLAFREDPFSAQAVLDVPIVRLRSGYFLHKIHSFVGNFFGKFDRLLVG